MGTPTAMPAGRGGLHRGINAWIAYKREYEADHVWSRSVPAELQLYDDCQAVARDRRLRL